MNDGNTKQQIVEKIKSSSNILVTVSTNPSVDELSAALGLTILLNKMKKHATAVFSGSIPPAITFLDPEKTFENTVDSLRDFIIALDKEKADHLRYKVEGDVVKIFITPYRTTITGDDLEFSQGDYNVELVLALGVKDRDDLDTALAAHGRILHDATVVTMGNGDAKSELGSIDWHEQNTSSLSEMLVTLSDSLKATTPLLDEQIATAFLTGIVAATDRFSNNRTSSKAMTVAAQLMSAGANQQLIASKLEEGNEIGQNAPATVGDSSQSGNSDGTVDLSEGESTKLDRKQPKPKKPQPKKDDGSLLISHEKQGDINEVAAQTAAEEQAKAAQAAEDQLDKRTREVTAENQSEAAKTAEQDLAKQLQGVASASTANSPSVADLQKDLAAASADVTEEAAQRPSTVIDTPLAGAVNANQWQGNDQPPSMGGTLNATTEQAEEDKRRAIQDDRNHTILSHGGSGYVNGATPAFQSPLNAASQPPDESPAVDPFNDPAPVEASTAPVAYAQPIQPPTTTLEELDKQNRAPHEEARAAVEAALGSAPGPNVSPVASLPPLPDFSTLPPLPQMPQPLQNDVQPMGALPPEKLEDMFASIPAAPVQSTQPTDPAQYKIPGQP